MPNRNHQTRGRAIATLAITLIALLAAAACEYLGFTGPPGQAEEAQPPPNLELASKAEVSRITAASQCIPGPCAEGRVGDYLIENSLVRFVIAAPDMPERSPCQTGGVLDAAIQGGQDYVNLLQPHVGSDAQWGIVCDDVTMQPPQKAGDAAQVTAVGHWRKNPGIAAHTIYRLAPDTRSLEIITTVRNETASSVKGVELGDIIYHGRTERFVPGMGLNPSGQRRQTIMLSFFAAKQVWDLHVPGALPFVAAHEPCFSLASYSEHTIPASGAQSYQRCLTVTWGSPARAIESLQPPPEATSSALDVQVRDALSGMPVPGACVQAASLRTGPASLALTDARGEATMLLLQGDYQVSCQAEGRAPFVCTVKLRAGVHNRLAMPLETPARLHVRVTELAGNARVPTCARLVIRRANLVTPQPYHGPAASGTGPGRVVLVPPSGEMEIPLACAPQGLETAYFVLASRGPLYEIAGRRVVLQPGDTIHLDLALEGAVHPDTYAAMDAGQPVSGSPECLLSEDERVLLSRCEGLDAIVARHAGTHVAARDWRPEEGSPFLPALGATTDHTGALTLIFSRPDLRPGVTRVPPYAQWGTKPEDVFALLRRYFLRSIIQVDDPMRENRGYFAITGFKPGAEPAQPFSPYFDALRILTGNETRRAAAALPCWFELLNQGRRIFVTAGSDSCVVGDALRMGARTYVHCPRSGRAATTGELWDALGALHAQPNAFVSNGPFLKVTAQGQPIGSLVTTKDGVLNLKVKVEGPQWLSIARVKVVLNGRVERTFTAAERDLSVLFEQELKLEVKKDSWLVVIVEGDKGMSPVYVDEDGTGAVAFAVTNPFWIDADGNGVCIVKP